MDKSFQFIKSLELVQTLGKSATLISKNYGDYITGFPHNRENLQSPHNALYTFAVKRNHKYSWKWMHSDINWILICKTFSCYINVIDRIFSLFILNSHLSIFMFDLILIFTKIQCEHFQRLFKKKTEFSTSPLI